MVIFVGDSADSSKTLIAGDFSVNILFFGVDFALMSFGVLGVFGVRLLTSFNGESNFLMALNKSFEGKQGVQPAM